jgi:hypothetical protein
MEPVFTPGAPTNPANVGGVGARSQPLSSTLLMVRFTPESCRDPSANRDGREGPILLQSRRKASVK